MTGAFFPEAIAELEEAFRFYEARSPGLGDDFRSEARHALDLVREHPRAWKPVGGESSPMQTKPLPYALIYGVDKERVIVVAVAGLRKKPGYWRKRLRKPRT